MVSLIQHFEADFLWKVSLKILNSEIILKTFTHVYVYSICSEYCFAHLWNLFWATLLPLCVCECVVQGEGSNCVKAMETWVAYLFCNCFPPILTGSTASSSSPVANWLLVPIPQHDTVPEKRFLVCYLTHIGIASFLWEKGQQCRPRSPQNAASYQGFH